MTHAGGGASQEAPRPLGLHHTGVTVADLNRSLSFWRAFLGVEPVFRDRLDGPHLAVITGYAGLSIEVAWLPLPGGLVLELVAYDVEPELREPIDRGTARSGNVHLAFRTDDIDGLWAKALAAGATATTPEPVTIRHGPNDGARTAYLRDPDGVTFELLQPPPSGDPMAEGTH